MRYADIESGRVAGLHFATIKCNQDECNNEYWWLFRIDHKPWCCFCIYRASWSTTMLLMFPEQLVLVPLMNVQEKSWKRKVEEMRFYVDRSNLVYVIEWQYFSYEIFNLCNLKYSYQIFGLIKVALHYLHRRKTILLRFYYNLIESKNQFSQVVICSKSICYSSRICLKMFSFKDRFLLLCLKCQTLKEYSKKSNRIPSI